MCCDKDFHMLKYNSICRILLQNVCASRGYQINSVYASFHDYIFLKLWVYASNVLLISGENCY